MHRRQRCLSHILVVDSTEEACLIRGAMSGTGLRLAGTGRCYLLGGCSLVRSQAVVDPNLLWWRSRGPVTVGRPSSTTEVVSHRVSEEDEHVRRYMVALEGRSDSTWMVL